MKLKKQYLIALAIAIVSIAKQIIIDTTPIKIGIAVFANSLFWVGLLQIDSMFWLYAGYQRMCEVYWVPEFAGTKLDWLGRAKNAFIVFCGLIIAGFYIFIGLMLEM